MGNPTRSKPWSVEVRVTDKWHHLDAYVDEDTAMSNAGIMRRRAPKAEFRIVKKKIVKAKKQVRRGK